MGKDKRKIVRVARSQSQNSVLRGGQRYACALVGCETRKIGSKRDKEVRTLNSLTHANRVLRNG